MRFLILTTVLFLTACGFAPVYKSGGEGQKNVSAALNQVDIAIIKDRDGQFLRNALNDPNVQKAIAGQTVKKVIVVPGRIVNVVAG